jgi:hypothetical protein
MFTKRQKPDDIVRIEPLQPRRPERGEFESKAIQEITRLPSAYRPVTYKRRKNIWYHRREREATQDPEIGNGGLKNQWGIAIGPFKNVSIVTVESNVQICLMRTVQSLSHLVQQVKNFLIVNQNGKHGHNFHV